ncbi:hypothetical protein Srubr_19260 [Streptomyces rubradiris]|uniref:Uncharacterized protein n=1 Tax=Streptomyces rubradiris TaxID=285531 RepID=A0ABQ3R8A1_STRRR|nr:hypothetical protein GCM10018792_59000 [Streptomyces rubradiris]GHI52080.1 hypothetical protein Srubr_19260 [Streptomyces rubradiris]
MTGDTAVIDTAGMEALVSTLIRRGRVVVGPTVRDDAIVLAELTSARELPYGWGVELEAGTYRLRRRADRMAFSHSAGPQSWKYYLHPQRIRQWSADRGPDGTVTVTEEADRPPSYAFLGVRPCDLAAIATQDRVLMGGPHTDDVYRRRRAGAFLVMVECVEPGATCFCVSSPVRMAPSSSSRAMGVRTAQPWMMRWASAMPSRVPMSTRTSPACSI